MATITYQGQPIQTCGELPRPGNPAPGFILTRTDLREVTSADLKGKRVMLSIFPHLDAAICARSLVTFNAHSAELKDSVLLCVSIDQPFAQGYTCATQGLDRAEPVSAYLHPEFGTAFGVTMVEGPLRGRFGRALVALDEEGIVSHAELVADLGQEPDYDQAIEAIRRHHQSCHEDALETRQ